MSSEARRHVLIVDAHPPDAQPLAGALQDRYRLSFATSGARALELAPAADLVLLDVQLPDLDGYEVCRRLKADPMTRDLPVIFVTVAGEVESETRGFEAGGVDSITKPINPPVVRARVQTHLELEESRDLLAELAARDGLTGVASRRRFDEVLAAEWRRAARERAPLTVALFDIDHFAAFNDRYGHARGDDCLRAVAESLAEATRRPADLVARVGGEEFALLLPGPAGDGHIGLLGRVLEGVRARGIPHAESPTASVVTLSCGAVTVVPEGDRPAATAFEAADRLLYEAKLTGRGRGFHEDETGWRTDIPGPPTGGGSRRDDPGA